MTVQDSDTADLGSLTREQLLDMKHDAELSLADIKGQLEKAESDYHGGGQRADADWFRRAKAAARYRAIELNRINARLSELRKAEKLENSRRHIGAIVDQHIAFLHGFYTAAKRDLSEEEFQTLIDLAFREIDSGNAYNCDRCSQARRARENA